jgi:F0F1-type ATP synthase assembly protein I
MDTRVLRMQPPARLTAPDAGHSVDPERKPATFPGEDRNRVERQYLRFAGVGVQFALTILLLTLFGIWLDGRLDTGQLFTLVFLLLGFVGATWSLIHQVLGPDKPGKPKPDKKV